MPVNIGDNRLIKDGIAFISEEDAEQLSQHVVQEGDVIYSRRGDVKRRALVRAEEDGWLCGTGCLKVRLGDGYLDPEYTYYYLGHPIVQDWILRHAVGATMPNLNTSIMASVPLLVPPIDEQRRIASILGSLDDKIEHNRRMAQALERLARAIFKAWFVDFEPVRAKVEGATSFPSMLQEVFDALPTTFVDTEIGPVPEGWEAKPIGDVVTVKGGATPSTKNPEFWEGGSFCFATPKDLSRLSDPILLNTDRQITQAGVNQITSRLLPVGTVLMSSRAPVGYLAIAGLPTAINQGFIAMICDGPLPPTYIIHWAHFAMPIIKQRAGGTTFAEISKKNFRSIQLVVPTPDMVDAYDLLTRPMYQLITSLKKESAQLVEIREYLLPRLMSGEIAAIERDGLDLIRSQSLPSDVILGA